jgi:DNA repair protein SbcC/Rad50
MKLTLQNFRCHEKRTFNIPENGLVNLSGSSGDGKSTVFAAMVYAFYGKIPGKSKKPYTHGKNTCKVCLQYETYGLNITRTSRPNRVIVTRGEDEGDYEDDAAQCVIEETLGMTYEEFIAGTYIIQRSNASVLSMTPTEQVKFIEILAFTNAEDFKLTVKEKQKDLSNRLLKLQGEIDSFQTLLEEAECNLQEEPETPQEIEDGIDPQKIRSDIKKNDKEIKKIRDVSKKLQAELQKARKDDIKYKTDQEKIEFIKATLASTNSSIKRLGSKKKSDGYKVRLEELKIRLIYNKKVKTLKERKEKFLEAFEAYQINTAETLNAMENNILTPIQLTELEEQLETAIEYKTNYDNEKAVYDSIMKKKTQGKKMISSLFHEIKSDSFCVEFCKDIKTPLKMIKALTSIQEQISCKLVCPSCNAKLFLGDGELKNSTISGKDSHPGEDLQKEKVSYFIHELSKYTEDSNSRAQFTLDTPEDVMRLQKEYMRRKREIEDYEKLKAQKLPPVLAKMEDSIKKEEDLLGDAKEEDINMLETEIDELKRIIEKIERENEELVNLKQEAKTLRHKIKNKTLSLPHLVGESKKLEEELSKSTKKLVDINEEVSNLRNVLENIKDYEDYQSQILNIKSLKKRLKKVQTYVSEKTSLLEGYMGLEGICKEAEILALEDTVASINEHAKIYLDYFFEDPILVRLECVKAVKSKKTFKLQMNTTIEYKGDTYGDIEELSGGERQRCDMAFLLAVNDILGGKMLLLDECLNNLDASINTEMLSLVRDLCGTDKLVLVISHEAVKGLFDYEIEVGKK